MAENRKEVIVMAKLSLSKWIYSSLFLSLTLSLAACGSPKTEAPKTSSSAKVSQTTSTSSSTRASASQASSSQVVASQASSSAKEEVPSSSQASTADSSQVSAPKPSGADSQTEDTLIPAALVGVWQGSSPQSDSVTLTVSSDGSLRAQANFGSFEDMNDVKAVARAVKVSQNLYRWELISGDYRALLPGITGLGGVGRAEAGFLLENGQYTSVLFTGPVDQPMDYSNYHAFGFSLTKK